MLGRIGRQFVKDHSNRLCRVWFKHDFGAFDTNTCGVASAVGRKLLAAAGPLSYSSAV